ncbi:MAG: DUF1559 domain-containing protein [Planctomycetota bacterium]
MNVSLFHLRATARLRGFTMIELAVVLGVVALLAALLLPAVAASREAARNAQCRNRMKQLGVATENFVAAEGVYPSALRLRDDDGRFSDHDYSGLVELLPYIDQAALYREIDPQSARVNRTSPPFSRWDDVSVSTFECPSDRGNVAGGGTNYRMNAGGTIYCDRTWQTPPESWPAAGEFGPFGLYRVDGPASVRDGASQTAATAEKLQASDTGDVERDVWLSGRFNLQPRYPTDESFLGLCISARGLRVGNDFFGYSGRSWVQPGLHHTLYNHAATPNAPGPDCDLYGSVSTLPLGGVFRATSNHPGNVNVLFLDGSVRAIADQVDAGVWRAMGTKASGEAF